MSKIIGNTTATPVAIPDWNQTDEKKADYIKNKPLLGTLSSLDTLEEKHIPDTIARTADVDEAIETLKTNVATQDAVVLSEAQAYTDKKISSIETPDSAEQVQADWAENDSESKAYILNRPFGISRYNIKDTTLEFEKSTYNDNYKSVDVATIEFSGEAGKTYIVEWDGVKYRTVCKDAGFPIDKNGVGNVIAMTVIGDPTLWNTSNVQSDVESTGEPFAIFLHSPMDDLDNAVNLDISRIVTNSNDATHTVCVYCEDDIIKLDQQYLPDETLYTVDTYTKPEIDDKFAALDKPVQSDWDQNDNTQLDFVRNRTHYSEGAPDPIVWDGVSPEENRSKFSPLTFFVTETYIKPEMYVGATITWSNGDSYTIKDEDIAYNPRPDSSDYGEFIIWTPIPDGNSNHTIFGFNKARKLGSYDQQPGTYLCRNGEYITRIDFCDYVKKLDEKYIPDTIARVGDSYTKTEAEAMVEEKLATIELPDASVQVQADWNQADTSAVDYIKNKPTNLATETFVEEKIAAIELPDMANQVQADLAQTDSSAVDFVKNQYFGILPDNFVAKEVIFDQGSLAVTQGYGAKGFATAVPLVIGQKYVVTWDGTEYELTAKSMVDIETPGLNVDFDNAPYLGNSNMSGFIVGSTDWGEDTGEPFFVTDSGCFTTDTTATTHVVGIKLADNKKKLDAQWLPDGLATKKFVEEKIAAIEIPEGGGGSSSDASELLEDVLELQELLAETTETSYYSDVFGVFIVDKRVDEAMYEAWNANTSPVVIRHDGIEYVLQLQTIDILGVTLVAVGNLSAFGGTGNDEPFALTFMEEDYGDEGKIYFVTLVSMVDTSETEHTVAIDLQVATQKLKKTYIPDDISVSWDNVTDKPFGKETATIFEGTFQDTLSDNNGDGVNDVWMGEMGIEDASDATLIVGETYTYTWEGVEYASECFMFYGLPTIGNSGVADGEDNGQPVFIARDSAGAMSGSPGWLAVLIGTPTDLTISGAYACRIVGPVKKCLDNKYLDFIEGEYSPETEIFEEQTVDGFEPDSPSDPESPYIVFINFTGVFVIGETYRVVWDDVEYEIVASNYNGLGALGDYETGDPFGMVATGSMLAVITTDKTDTSHKIRIIRQATTPKIKEECIPEPAIPEFDLTAMGLPALTIGGSVEVECDTTVIRAALDKGSVKLKFTANVGIELPVSYVANAMCMGGDYQCGFVGNLAGTPMLLSFEMLSTKITGSIITLAIATA